MKNQTELQEKIISSIDNLHKILGENPDLKDDVLPFISSTLDKVDELAKIDLSNNPDTAYNLFQIGTNYLPRTIIGYCSFPLEYRNTQKIKNDKTPRDLMILDLTVLKRQVVALEKEAFAEIEIFVRGNSSFLKTKYEGSLELASEMDKNPDEFINQFQLDKNYSKMVSYFGSQKKEVLPSKEKSKVILELAKKLIEKTKKSYLKNMPIIIYYTKQFKRSVKELFIESVQTGAIFGIAFVALLAYLFFGVLIPALSTDSYDSQAYKRTQSIYSILSANKLNTEQLKDLSLKQSALFIEKTKEDKESLSIQNTERSVVAKFIKFDRDECEEFIDKKEADFFNAQVYVNNIQLPESHIYSNNYYVKNNNHSLCYLKQNEIKVEFNNDELTKYRNDHKESKDNLKKYLLEDEKKLSLIVEERKSSKSSYSYEKELEKLKTLKKEFEEN